MSMGNAGLQSRRISVSSLVELHELTGFSMTEVTTRRDPAAAARWLATALDIDPPAGVGVAVTNGSTWVLGTGPGRWRVRTEGHWREDVPPAGLYLTGISDAWRIFQISGIAARRLLAGGSPLDVDRQRFGPGRCAATRYDDFHVLLVCTGLDAYELHVERSWAEDLRSRIVLRAAALATPSELDG